MLAGSHDVISRFQFGLGDQGGCFHLTHTRTHKHCTDTPAVRARILVVCTYSTHARILYTHRNHTHTHTDTLPLAVVLLFLQAVVLAEAVRGDVGQAAV